MWHWPKNSGIVFDDCVNAFKTHTHTHAHAYTQTHYVIAQATASFWLAY